MGAASNARIQYAEWRAEQEEIQRGAGGPPRQAGMPSLRPGVIRYPKPPKPFKQMTGAEYIAWDNQYGFAKAMTPPPRYPGRG